MKIRMTFTFNAECRKAIRGLAHNDGKPASYREVRSWISDCVDATTVDILADAKLQQAELDLSGEET